MANGYWTRERTLNGLKRFARDYFDGKESELPARMHNYRATLSDAEWRQARRLRLYPDYQVVFRYFKDFPEAWATLGYSVEMTPLQYWTRDEVLNGLKRFYADFGFCPTYKKYVENAAFTEKFGKNGKPKPDGAYNKYPGFLSIRKYFGTMRQAWQAAGFDVNNHWEAWSPLEDWFIIESCGVLPRKEVADYIKRSEAAVKRRLYDLGRITANTRWGMSLNRAGSLLGIGASVIRKYLEYGFMPFYRGNKNLYINPADLLLVTEIDWSQPVHDELDKEIRAAIAQRIAKIAKYGADWRKHELYSFQKSKEYLKLRIKNPRKSAFADKLPDQPNDLAVGDWIKLKRRVRQVDENRFGIIKGIFYSPQKQPRVDGTKRCAWIASVEFPKLKRLTGNGENRIRYNIPLDALERMEKPFVPEKPLSMHPEAVRGRKRLLKHRVRAVNRLNEISGMLT